MRTRSESVKSTAITGAFFRRPNSSPIVSAKDPTLAIPAIVVEVATIKSIPPDPIIAVPIAEAVTKEYATRSSAVPSSVPGIVTIYKPPFAEAVIPLAVIPLPTVPLTIIPLAILAAPALIAEGCYGHRQHEQKPEYHGGY